MIGFVQRVARQQKLKKNLLAFLAEMEKNLETFYVMDQRQFITGGFLTMAWGQVKDETLIKKHASISEYVRAIEDFNNVRASSGMRNDLVKKLEVMEGVIILAGQALEREMLHLGLLK